MCACHTNVGQQRAPATLIAARRTTAAPTRHVKALFHLLPVEQVVTHI
jgi:hypothetical protein